MSNTNASNGSDPLLQAIAQANAGTTQTPVQAPTEVVSWVKDSKSALVVFKELSAREKHLHRSINIDAFAKKLELSQDEVLTIFKRLETMQLGSIVVGRDNTCPTQFVPQYSLRHIGNMAFPGKEEKETQAPVVPSKRKPGRPAGSKNKAFDRAAFMRKKWASGKMGRKPKGKRGRPAGTRNSPKIDKKEILRHIAKLLNAA